MTHSQGSCGGQSGPHGDWQGCQWVPLEMPFLTLRSGHQGSSLESSAWGLSARNRGSGVKNPPATAGGARDLGLIPGSGSAGVQPRQDPGVTLRMNGVGERRHVRPTLIGPSLRGREREREGEGEGERESDQTGGCWQGLAGSGNALFFTVAFIP